MSGFAGTSFAQALRTFGPSVYLHMEHDDITIYEDVSNKNNLFQYINDIIHEIYNDSIDVAIELEIFYEDKMLKLRLH